MENQEIPKAQETQKTQETQKIRTTKKEKNPKRVAAGKKGSEARWNKQKPQEAEHEPIKITKEPHEPIKKTKAPQRPLPTVNVYKNYIQLCVLIGAVGFGIYMIYGKKTEIKQPKVQPETKQTSIDPFEMR